MQKDSFLRKVLPIFIVLLNVGLSISVIFLMHHVQNLLNMDIKINLTEIVTQNKNAISSRLMMRLNSLDVMSNKITNHLKMLGAQSDDEIRQAFLKYAAEKGDPAILLANRDGVLFLQDGRQIDISGRKYFQLSMSGTSNISDKIISRIDGNEIFVISVPIDYEGKTVGTIQKLCTEDDMRKLCALSLFSDWGHMYLVNKDGYVILHSKHMGCYQRTDNYFRDLYSYGNKDEARKIRSDITDGKSGFMECNIEGRKIFSAYTPVDRVQDWYLITSVPIDIASPNGSSVINIFYVVLFTIVFIFTSVIAYFSWYKNRQSAILEKLAFVDTITGGNTYNKFTVDMTKSLLENPDKDFYIVKFDIDNFKYINNSYGFNAGDSILRDMDKNISAALRPGEIIARVSGDHFVMFLDDGSRERLATLLEPISYDGINLYLSAGVYKITDRTEDINLMADKAGIAAQSIKTLMSKKIEYYSDEFEKHNVHNETLKRAIKLAIGNNEFLPFYQPKVDIYSNAVVGGEALARWIGRDGAIIYPGEFIPMCEQTGLIVEIDMLIYEKVLIFLRDSMEQGSKCVPISVNFSRLHLLNDDFVDNIVQKQQSYNIPAGLIEIELTENAFLDNLGFLYEFTNKMHHNGFLIAMDDFGSGYSSLNMLKDIPIDILKVDKAFLSDAGDSKRRDTIFSCITDMARKLDIKVVVEGVEHVENVDLMKKCGCTIAQGYYFAKPVREADFRKMLGG